MIKVNNALIKPEYFPNGTMKLVMDIQIKMDMYMEDLAMNFLNTRKKILG